jgi:hypothetical protein
MRRYKFTVAVLMAALVAASLQGCVGSSMAGRRWCNSSSAGCMALKAQQSKTGTIAAQQARCCS